MPLVVGKAFSKFFSSRAVSRAVFLTASVPYFFLVLF